MDRDSAVSKSKSSDECNLTRSNITLYCGIDFHRCHNNATVTDCDIIARPETYNASPHNIFGFIKQPFADGFIIAL